MVSNGRLEGGMRGFSRRSVLTGAMLLAMMATLSCSEINRSSAPVKLVVTSSQTILNIDLQPGAAGCTGTLGTIQMQVILLQNPNSPTQPVDNRFNDVHITRYHVSYRRTDGGTQVPAPYDVSVSESLTAGGGAQSLTDFLVFQQDALNMAPFAALLPINGGRDPETGRPIIKMDVIVDVFGQTLAGEKVSGSTAFQESFCFGCGGCF